jgi:hypothetical protein
MTEKEYIYLEDYTINNKIIEYNINTYNHFYITNDFLRTYKKLFCLIFKENKIIKKDEKINIVVKMPIYINGENVKYVISDFDKECCTILNKYSSLKTNLVLETENNTYDLSNVSITMKNIKTDIYFIINYTADKDYFDVKNIGYNIYFTPQKLNIVSKSCISNEEINNNLNISLKLIKSNIIIDELYLENNNLKLYDYTKLYGKITSDFPILEYKITDKVNKKNIKLKNEGYNEELDKYIYTIDSTFILLYDQKNSVYNISITDCNFCFIEETKILPITVIYK